MIKLSRKLGGYNNCCMGALSDATSLPHPPTQIDYVFDVVSLNPQSRRKPLWAPPPQYSGEPHHEHSF